MQLNQSNRLPAPPGRGLSRYLMLLALLLSVLCVTPAQAQRYNEGQRPTETDEVINLGALPSGRLQNIDWKSLELRIDGKTYPFDDTVLKVYYRDRELTLVDLAPNADIRYQLSRKEGANVVVRIWVMRPEGLVPS